MDIRPVDPDVTVLRDDGDRSVVVRGKQYVTAVDVPRRPSSVCALLQTCRELAAGGLRLAILTREPDDAELPIQALSGARVIRADRQKDGVSTWDVIPPDLLRVRHVPVHLVRSAKTLYDDAGRAFHCRPCACDCRSLEVLIDPGDVLVTALDVRPDAPPLIGPCRASETISRLRCWRAAPPKILVPATGTPIRGEDLGALLDRSIDYLERLRERVWADMSQARFPWERLIYSVEARQFWSDATVSPLLVRRHRANVRAIAEDAWHCLVVQPESALLAAAA